MDKWNGKICLISGASAGIGADICLKLANCGMIVIGIARRVNKVNELNSKIDKESNGKIYGRKCDLGIESEILEAFKWVASEFGKIDVFINNAGIFVSKFIIESETESFRKLFDINVIAACVCLREAVKLMRETSTNGQILVINSILGHRIPDVPYPAFGVYPGTKHALTAITQVIRQELAFYKLPIKLTSISPGMVETDLLLEVNQDIVKNMPKLQVSDVTDAVIYALETADRVCVDNVVINPKM